MLAGDLTSTPTTGPDVFEGLPGGPPAQASSDMWSAVGMIIIQIDSDSRVGPVGPARS